MKIQPPSENSRVIARIDRQWVPGAFITEQGTAVKLVSSTLLIYAEVAKDATRVIESVMNLLPRRI